MSKAVLSRFLIERIHKDWIDRLYPQGWTREKEARDGKDPQGGHRAVSW